MTRLTRALYADFEIGAVDTLSEFPPGRFTQAHELEYFATGNKKVEPFGFIMLAADFGELYTIEVSIPRESFEAEEAALRNMVRSIRRWP